MFQHVSPMAARKVMQNGKNGSTILGPRVDYVRSTTGSFTDLSTKSNFVPVPNKFTSPVVSRSAKVKSWFPPIQGEDCQNFSEDGEVSSGGQEVAEIIGRNSKGNKNKVMG